MLSIILSIDNNAMNSNYINHAINNNDNNDSIHNHDHNNDDNNNRYDWCDISHSDAKYLLRYHYV